MLEKLPTELLDHIFVFVHPKQLLTLRLCNQWANGLVQFSSCAQYRIECWAAGVTDDRIHQLSYSESLSLLRQREARWQSGRPLKKVKIGVQSADADGGVGLYDLNGGMLALGRGRTGFSILKLPSLYDSPNSDSREWRHHDLGADIIDFALAEEDDDLIAVVTSKRLEDIPLGTDFLGMETTTCCFDLHIYSASSGDPHPRSLNPIVQLNHKRDVVHAPSAAIQVLGDYIVVLLFNTEVYGDEYTDELYCVNWKTGTNTLLSTYQARTYQCPVVLSASLILLPNMRSNTLDLYTFHGLNASKRSTPRLTPRGSLDLPPISSAFTMVGYQCISRPGLGLNAENHPIRVRSSPEDALVVFAPLYRPQGLRRATLIVHRRILLSAAALLISAHGNGGPSIPYARWGAGRCSWGSGSVQWITMLAGQRLCARSAWIPSVRGEIPLSVRDYNPHNVRRALSSLNKRDGDSGIGDGVIDPAVTRVVVPGPGEKVTFGGLFVEGVESRLPYVETKIEVEDDVRTMTYMLDDERLIGIEQSPASLNVHNLHIQVFG
ncbi:unnamed protein product [Peniophora sp. CBMAI 1063]|nr:unnamed protein product [Peniophora sp. CBMAI 1063]